MKQQIYILIACLVVSPVYAKIERSQAAKDLFKQSHPCPSNGHTSGACPDYVIDHIKALACGGADDPSNMQWQTKTEAKTKDKWERDECQPKPKQVGQYFIGKKGGCYFLKNGKKQYVDRSFCK